MRDSREMRTRQKTLVATEFAFFYPSMGNAQHTALQTHARGITRGCHKLLTESATWVLTRLICNTPARNATPTTKRDQLLAVSLCTSQGFVEQYFPSGKPNKNPTTIQHAWEREQEKQYEKERERAKSYEVVVVIKNPDSVKICASGDERNTDLLRPNCGLYAKTGKRKCFHFITRLNWAARTRTVGRQIEAKHYQHNDAFSPCFPTRWSFSILPFSPSRKRQRMGKTVLYVDPPPLPIKNTQAMRSWVYWCNVGKWSLPCKPACPSKTLHKATGHSGHTNTPTEHIQTTQARTVIEQQQTPCYNDPWCVCLRTLALSLYRVDDLQNVAKRRNEVKSLRKAGCVV